MTSSLRAAFLLLYFLKNKVCIWLKLNMDISPFKIKYRGINVYTFKIFFLINDVFEIVVVI